MKINKRYSAERDLNGCWTLTETYMGKETDPKTRKTTGKLKKQKKHTYYGRFEFMCNAILDREIGDCKDIRDVRDKIRSVRKEFKLVLGELKV